MNNEQMLAAVLALPGADLMTASKIDDPIGAGNYYRADTVVRLLAATLGVDLGRAAAQKFNEVSERVGFPDRIELAL